MTITVSDAKDKATRIRERMAAMGKPITHAQALEVLATTHGDTNWAAMKARLEKRPGGATKKAPSRLGWFTVALYAQLNENGGREFLAKRTILCFTAEQAREYLRREYFPTAYDETDFAHAHFETEPEVLDDKNMPDSDDLCTWLSERMHSHFEGVGFNRRYWGLMESHGMPAPSEDEQFDKEVLYRTLVEVAPTFSSAQVFFQALYRILPEGTLYSQEEPLPGGFDPGLRWGDLTATT